MTITDLVAPEAILPALKVNSKKQALQELGMTYATIYFPDLAYDTSGLELFETEVIPALRETATS